MIILQKCGAKLSNVFESAKKTAVFCLIEGIKKVRTQEMRTFFKLYQAPTAYRFGLILLHSEMAGTMFRSTSSSRILQRCS